MSGRLPTSAEISFDLDGFDDMQIGAGQPSIDRNSRNSSSPNPNYRSNANRNPDPRNTSSRPQPNSSRQQNRPHSGPHNRPQSNTQNRPQNRPNSSNNNSKPPPPKIIPLINNYQFSSSPPTVQDLIQHFNFILTELENYAPESQHDAPIEKFETQFKNAVTDFNLTPIDSTKTNQKKIEFPKYLSELIRQISQKVKYGGDKLEKPEKEEIKEAVFGFVSLLRVFDRIFGVDCVDLFKLPFTNTIYPKNSQFSPPTPTSSPKPTSSTLSNRIKKYYSEIFRSIADSFRYISELSLSIDFYNHTLQVDPKASFCYNSIFDIWHERQISNLRRRKHLKDKKDRVKTLENDDMIVQAGFEMTWSLSRGVCNADEKVGFEMSKKYRTNFSVYAKSLPAGDFWEPYFNRFSDHAVYLDRWILKNESQKVESDKTEQEFSDSVLKTGGSGDSCDFGVSGDSADSVSKIPTCSEKLAMAATVFLFYRLFTGVDLNNLEMDKLRRFIKPEISEKLISKIREIMVYLLIRSKTQPSNTVIHQSVECFLKTANFCFKTHADFQITEQLSNSSPSISSPSYSPFKSSRKTLIIGDSLLRDQHSKFIQKGSSVDVICLPGQTVQGVFSTLQNMVGTLKIGRKFENAESGQELRIKSLLQIKKLIIHCGTNDASTKFSVKDLEKVIDMYAKMVDYIGKEFVEIEDIVVTTLIPRFDKDRERVLEFNKILKKRFESDLAQDKRVKLENLYMVMVNQTELYQPDYLHLNDEGKEKLHDSLDKISRDALDDSSEKINVEVKNPENLKILKTLLDFVVTNGWVLKIIREICEEGDPATLKCSHLLPEFYDKMYFGGSESSKFVKNVVDCGVDFGSVVNDGNDENDEKLELPALNSCATFAPFQKLKKWHISDNMTINRMSKTVDKISVRIPPVLLPANINFITPKILVLDTNLYLETENVELLTDLILKDFLKNYKINLYIPKIVQDEMLGIAQEQDKKVERAMTGRKLVHGLLLHDQVCEKEIPKHILVKHAQGHANDKKSSGKNRKAADDVLLDYCVWLEQQSWKFNPSQISRVVFITHDKNLKLKAEMVFDNCGEPRPVHLESIGVLKNLFRDVST